MVARRALTEPVAEVREGAYFSRPSESLSFVSSGSSVLDCVLGGGYVIGRMSNIIGDKSTAKTGLTIEAMATFARDYPKGKIYHRECESAFDVPYAKQIGYPNGVRSWDDDYDHPLETVEDVFEDLEKIMPRLTQPALYVIDSLDALSDRAEMDRKIGDTSYAMGKQKKLSELFRRLARQLERAQICLLIVSQVRDNIGVSFGEKYRRSGGKALDFYASQLLWLANTGTVKARSMGEERVTSIEVRARCKKNKAGLPGRECTFTYRLGFGIDDLATSAAWLASVKKLEDATGHAKAEEFIKEADKYTDADYREITDALGQLVRENWAKIETALLPTRRKYV